MLTTILTIPQKEIIQEICDMQIQALLRISMENKMVEYVNEIGYDVTPGEINADISVMLKTFDNLKSFPSKVFSLDERYFSLVKHNLLHTDEVYSEPYYLKHKRNLWEKIIIRDNFDLIMS